MKAAVITFPGSNCDDDLVYSLGKDGGFAVDSLWHKDHKSLGEYSLVALPGGFSFGDYLRCGAVASLSPLMENVKEYARAGGLVLGICNGFQILCEAGLLPGALARNGSLRFVCKDVELEVAQAETPWTNLLRKGQTVKLPVAHGDGRYVVDDSTLAKMRSRGQIVLTYRDNPNGSVQDIAGVCNSEKNVFGLMPHPERASDLRSLDGQLFWKSVRRFLQEKAR